MFDLEECFLECVAAMGAYGFRFKWLFATEFVLGGEIDFGGSGMGFMGVEIRSWVGDVGIRVFISVYFGCSAYIQRLYNL